MEPGEVHYFRSRLGGIPICQLARAGNDWLVLFYRGPANLGPYSYQDFEKAKAHLMRYLRPREEALCGEAAVYAAVSSNPTQGAPLSIVTRHPRRARL